MAAINDWDIIFIELLKNCKSTGIKKPVISFPLNAYSVDSDKNRVLPENCHKYFYDRTDKIIDLKEQIKTEYALKRCMYGLAENNEVFNVFTHFFSIEIDNNNLNRLFEFIYVSGAFIFAEGHISKVKPNKKILYLGDEVLHSCRLYTHGYTVVRSSFNYFVLHLTRSESPDHKGNDWSNDRRRIAYEDCMLGPNNEYLSKIWQNLWGDAIEEIKKIFLLRRKDDQSFGTEKDFQDICESLLI